MGKKSRMKKLGRIAADLPVIHQQTCYKEKCKGEELIADGIQLANKEKVNPNGDYVKRVPTSIPVSHKRRIKKMFAKHGDAGVAAYVNAVDDFVQKAEVKDNVQVR